MPAIIALALALLAVSIPAALSSKEACACPYIYMPVCGADGKNYSNDCVAKCAGTTVASQGACPTPAAKPSAVGSKICPCPRIYLPVCDTKGTQYDNECVAKCAGATLAPCPDEAVTTSPAPEVEKPKPQPTPAAAACACPLNYDPVCGSDGKTYPNDCLFTRCRTPDFQVQIAYKGSCKGPAPAKPASPVACACPAIYAPVCGSDGKTYDNDCLFSRCRTPDFKVTIVSRGPCSKPAVPAVPAKPVACACPANYVPVCGSDGKTYDNDCLFTRCRTPDFKVKIVHEGPCIAAAPAEPAKPVACACPAIYAPVCGSDGKTYDNDCLFTRCRTPDFKVTIAYKGPCKEKAALASAPSSISRPCICPMVYAPLCGSDGKTYSNSCVFACSHPPGVEIVHKGACMQLGVALVSKTVVVVPVSSSQHGGPN